MATNICLIFRGYKPNESLTINHAAVGGETPNIMLSLCTRFWRADTCRQPLTENASLLRPWSLGREYIETRLRNMKIQGPKTKVDTSPIRQIRVRDQDCSAVFLTRPSAPAIIFQSRALVACAYTLLFHSHLFIPSTFAMYPSRT